MQVLCCFHQNKGSRVSFRDRLPEHIKKLTVDVTFTKTEIQPKCVQSPKVRRYDYESDCDSDNDAIASFNPNFGCSKS